MHENQRNTPCWTVLRKKKKELFWLDGFEWFGWSLLSFWLVTKVDAFGWTHAGPRREERGDKHCEQIHYWSGFIFLSQNWTSLIKFTTMFTVWEIPFNEVTWKTDVWPSFGNWWKSIIGSLHLAATSLNPLEIGANTHSNRRLISGLSGNFRFQPTIQFWRKDEKTKFSPATGVCIKPCDEAKSVLEKRFQPVWLGKCHIGQICNFVQGKFPQGWKGSSNTLCSEQISQNFFCPSFFKINERQKEVCLSLNLKAKLVSSKLYTCVRQSLLSIYYGDHYLHLHIIQHTYMTCVLKRALPDIIITLWTKKNLTTFFPQDWK